MANANISNITLTNTFNEWRVATNDLITDRNILRNSNYVKDEGNFAIANGTLQISRLQGGTTFTNDNDMSVGGTITTANIVVTLGANVTTLNASSVINSASYVTSTGQNLITLINSGANTVRVSANNGSTLSSKQLNFVNTATITVVVSNAPDGNANVAFTAIGGGGGGTGPQGPQGPQGPSGVSNVPGPQGPQGVAGPSNAINASADTTSSTLYPVSVATSGSNQVPKISANFLLNAVNSAITVGSTSHTTARLGVYGIAPGSASNNTVDFGEFNTGQSLSFLCGYALTNGLAGGISDSRTMTLRASGPVAGNIAFATGNSERIRLTNVGRLGIGTATPTSELDVNGTISLKGVVFAETLPNYTIIREPSGSNAFWVGNINDPGNYSDNTSTIFRSRGGGLTYAQIGTSSTFNGQVSVANLVIAGYGQVINSSGQWTGAGGMTGPQGPQGPQGIAGPQGPAGSGGSITNDNSSASTFYPVMTTSTSGTLSGVTVSASKFSFVPNNGTLTATDFAATSDSRLKTVVRKIYGATQKIKEISAFEYYWNDLAKREGVSDDDSIQIGVLAQEVELMYPSMVVTGKDGYKRVNYDKLVPVLIQCIKELNERIETLERK